MRHYRRSEKFSRNRAQRKALVKSLLRALIIYERITTTESKAKGIRPAFDKLITWAKENTLHSRRLAFSMLQDHALVKKLFESIGPRYNGINGGYTRIYDIGHRKGDDAKMSIIELTKLEKKKKKTPVKKEKAKQTNDGQDQEQQTEQEVAEKGPQKKGLISGMKKIFKKEKNAL